MAFIIFLLVAAIGTGRDLVSRHYDYLETMQDNTRVEQRIQALREAQGLDNAAARPGAMLTVAACGFGAIAFILAMAAAIGQGGLVGLLNNANKLIRSAKRSRYRSQPPQRSHSPDREPYVMVTDPAKRQLPVAARPPSDDDIRWT